MSCGRWCNRRHVIKYIANVAHGVHSGAPSDEFEKIVANVRRAATFRAPPGAFVSLNMSVLQQEDNTEIPFRYSPDALDPALVEIASTLHFLTNSPKLIDLESLIKTELDQFG
jgi:hypothetical protein